MTSPSQPDSPHVSAIVPTHNRAQLLEIALQSIADQEYGAIEVIVVDDASTDDTAAIVERVSRMLDERSVGLKYEHLDTNAGPAAARNLGVAMATGSFVGFLDSDDKWRPRFLTATVALLTTHSQCAVAFTGAVRIDQDDDVLGPLDHHLPAEPMEGVLHAPFEPMVRHMPFRTSCTLLRRTVFDDAGGFDEALRSSEDWDLWWRLGKQFDFAYTLEPLMEYRDHPGNLSKTQVDGLVHSLRFHLRHVADIQDPTIRSLQVARVQRRQTQLQELLLSKGVGREVYRELLDNEFTPQSLRFRAGSAAMHTPPFVRRAYARAVRGTSAVRGRRVGRLRRGSARAA
jgi:glycosyltransferase involved in cell wall biosynthesis